MQSARRLQKELSFEMAKLNGLQSSVDPTLDDTHTKVLATEIRKQAGICLHLLDQYQLSVPGRMWTYTESRCRPLRDDLRRTEMLFRDASGEFLGRMQTSDTAPPAVASVTPIRPHFSVEDLFAEWADPVIADEEQGACSTPTSVQALSRSYIELHNDHDLDGLMALVDDGVEFKLAFEAPLDGKAAVRRQYEREWADHERVVMEVKEVFETETKVAMEIHVDLGPPSDLRYNGVVVHHWNDEGRLVRLQLYVDDVNS